MNRNQIYLAIDYIEDHILQPMTVTQLAEISGYSVDHFAHSFRSITGLSVAAYIRRQRLSLSASELLRGTPVTKTALKYGFDTPSGFSKAFRKYYGMSPQEYKSTYSNKPAPSFQTLGEFTAIAYLLTPPDTNHCLPDAAAYWYRQNFSFHTTSAEDWNRIALPGAGEIGAWLPAPSTGGYQYALGPIAKDASFVPEHMHAVTIPAAHYAVYTVPRCSLHTELKRNVVELWRYIFNKQLNLDSLCFDREKVAFELYQGLETYLYVPIMKSKSTKATVIKPH